METPTPLYARLAGLLAGLRADVPTPASSTLIKTPLPPPTHCPKCGAWTGLTGKPQRCGTCITGRGAPWPRWGMQPSPGDRRRPRMPFSGPLAA